MNPTLWARNRFGLGPRLGEPATLGDPRGWLSAQLHPAAGRLDGGPSLADVSTALATLRRAQQARDEASLAAARRTIQRVATTEQDLLLDTRVTTTTPFVERLVAFWSNHLCVSTAKGQAAPFTGHYERTVIRPHVLGRFHDMVLASARHPAMLLYLDNAQSIGPGSLAGRRSARGSNARGLNENYARELLELHTVGVDGGYAQDDVIALARILTGWTITGAGPGAERDAEIGFVFRAVVHEPGSKTVMGRRYSDAGVREGEAVIRDLCAHPSTARFVATKLVRHFVADDPPAAAVDRIASVFRSTDGDLRAVALALVALDAAWDPSTPKFRTPLDWLTAAYRALGTPEAPGQAGAILRQLGQPVWGPAAPKGYGDTRSEWADPDALMNRAEAARTLTQRLRNAPEPGTLLTMVDVADGDPLRVVVADGRVAANERLALAIGGPAFQWR